MVVTVHYVWWHPGEDEVGKKSEKVGESWSVFCVGEVGYGLTSGARQLLAKPRY